MRLAVTIWYTLSQVCLQCILASLSTNQKQDIVELHNNYRRLVASNSTAPFRISNMNSLRWSLDLAEGAMELLTCDSRRPRVVQRLRRRVDEIAANRGVSWEYGINAGRRRHSRMASIQIVQRWYRQQHSRYDVIERSCWPHHECNEYRNMLNAKHKEIGCAVRSDCTSKTGSQLDVLMCLYRGGDPDTFDYKYGHSCSGCDSPNNFCNNTLCVPCDPSRQDCRATFECAKTCAPNIHGMGVLNNTACTCDCQHGNGPNCDKPCANPSMYEEDGTPEAPCSYLTSRAMCVEDPGNVEMLREFCPEQCACNKLPY